AGAAADRARGAVLRGGEREREVDVAGGDRARGGSVGDRGRRHGEGRDARSGAAAGGGAASGVGSPARTRVLPPRGGLLQLLATDPAASEGAARGGEHAG